MLSFPVTGVFSSFVRWHDLCFNVLNTLVVRCLLGCLLAFIASGFAGGFGFGPHPFLLGSFSARSNSALVLASATGGSKFVFFRRGAGQNARSVPALHVRLVPNESNNASLPLALFLYPRLARD